MSLIDHIRQNFSRHAQSYESAAQIQAHAADRLAELFVQNLPLGPILEIGCGTGLLSQKIAAAYPTREIHFTDLSPEMVEATKNRLGEKENFHFSCLNGEEINPQPQYAAIFSSFTLQWFLDLQQGLKGLSGALLSGGYLCVALQGSESYPEWKAACKELKIPFGGNLLASKEEFVAIDQLQSIQLVVTKHQSQYPKALDFFHHFKELGANTAINSGILPFLDFKLLLKKLDQSDPVEITTEIIYYIGIKT